MSADDEKWAEWRQQWVSSRYVPRNAIPETLLYPRAIVQPEPDRVTGSGFMQTICDMTDEGEIAQVFGASIEECQRRTEAMLYGLNLLDYSQN
ncbi:hypothetical protein LCGC14_2851080 [marine sediment metagenome]|uniref:Uncharacterized protein n=1 Tax=marine sediment metagenome TaxID=412755 RepID=A0A0F8Y8C8_9ZZZZ